jgi:hypothetical protein
MRNLSRNSDSSSIRIEIQDWRWDPLRSMFVQLTQIALSIEITLSEAREYAFPRSAPSS